MQNHVMQTILGHKLGHVSINENGRSNHIGGATALDKLVFIFSRVRKEQMTLLW